MEARSEIKIDIGLVGNSAVGKTSLIRKYKFREGVKAMTSTISTIGVDK
jgi:GTPase SAR1 family protein